MKSFWQRLPRPFFALAPLEDVTDAAFRRLIASCGKPDVMYTEFTSADGLLLADEKGKQKLLKKLLYSESERPIVAQVFTSVPDTLERVAAIIGELGFDGVDINMGCPDRAVEKSGCGAALIKHPALARELLRAAKRGAPGLPVSLKTRIGYNKDELESWLPELLAEAPAAIAIHARTRKEMSDVPARWDHIKRAVAIRNNRQGEASTRTLIIGNGDVENMEDAQKKAAESGCDGVMLGRAIFGTPWLFSHSQECENVPQRNIRALIEHLNLFEELLGDTTNYAVMKKHFKAYISGWAGAKDLRTLLMETESAAAAKELLLTELAVAELEAIVSSEINA
ncbi:MAG: tRNA-dihydrouridine synthase [Candidatus Kaiserbacteria bacterium]|nr:MAG: tRNA-dihydrouridine synthase [Candidatus Kaiserbacteria bacterium]